MRIISALNEVGCRIKQLKSTLFHESLEIVELYQRHTFHTFPTDLNLIYFKDTGGLVVTPLGLIRELLAGNLTGYEYSNTCTMRKVHQMDYSSSSSKRCFTQG